MAEKITIDKDLLHEVLICYLFDMFEKNNLPMHNTMWSIAEEIVANIERVNNTVTKQECPPGFHFGTNRDGVTGFFEDYEESIGEI